MRVQRLDEIEVEEAFAHAFDWYVKGVKNEETQDFIRETAGTKLQGLLTEALELDDDQLEFNFWCNEFSDRERSILSLNKIWGQEQRLMVNELYDGMKTKMGLLLFLHHPSNGPLFG